MAKSRQNNSRKSRQMRRLSIWRMSTAMLTKNWQSMSRKNAKKSEIFMHKKNSRKLKSRLQIQQVFHLHWCSIIMLPKKEWKMESVAIRYFAKMLDWLSKFTMKTKASFLFSSSKQFQTMMAIQYWLENLLPLETRMTQIFSSIKVHQSTSCQTTLTI